MLGSKAHVKSNDDWLRCYEAVTDAVSRSEIDELTADTVKSIRKMARRGRVCSGWNPGKDSIVLNDLLERSGIEYDPICWRGVNEYPAMTEWFERNRPAGLKVSVVGKFTLPWLEENPDFLFCQGDTRQRWMAEKWKHQRHDTAPYDLFAFGRRLKDGNRCGTKADGYLMGKTWAPMAEWSHEQLLAYIRYNQLELPPFYSWPRGFLLGSVAMGEWTERPCKGLSVTQVWDEIWGIDPSIIEGAARVLTSARQYLEEK